MMIVMPAQAGIQQAVNEKLLCLYHGKQKKWNALYRNN
jgi:hypothetical protein